MAQQTAGPTDTWDPDYMPLYPDLGYGNYRVSTRLFSWGAIETAKGVFDWSYTDATMAYVESQLPPGIEIMFCCRNLPIWWAPGDMADFVTALANRYPRIKNMQIWNEPDASSTADIADAATFALVTQGVPAAWRAARPRGKVIGPCITSNGLSFYRTLMEQGTFVEGNSLDALSVNAYNGSGEPEALPAHLSPFTAFAAEQGLPIWNTEFTWHSFKLGGAGTTYTFPTLMEADEAASRVARAHPLFCLAGFERFFWYALDTHMTGINGSYSCVPLADFDGLLPAGEAMQYQLGLVRSWHDLSQSTALWSVGFRAKDGRTGRMMWRPAGQSGNVDTTAWSEAADVYGNSLALSASYALTNVPIYVFE